MYDKSIRKKSPTNSPSPTMVHRPIYLTLIPLFLFWILPPFALAEIICTYDELNRLTYIVFDNGASASFLYDEVGNMSVLNKTDPTDSDNDGLWDAIEQQAGTDPNDADSDDDGIMDGFEDANRNGIVDENETSPLLADSDEDGLQDGTEQGVTISEVGPDTDISFFTPDADPQTTTSPVSADSDSDGFLDGEEDINHNGAVDPGELDPNQVNIRSLPWIHLLLLDDEESSTTAASEMDNTLQLTPQLEE